MHSSYNVLMSNTDFDVCVRGSGIVGRTLALLLGRAKLRVALVEPATQTNAGAASIGRDIRAYALNHASRQLLETIRCWPSSPATTPVKQMCVFGDAGGVIHFDAGAGEASNLGDALAWIVDVPSLEDRLEDALSFQPFVERVNEPVEAPLTAICEGKFSVSRENLAVVVDTYAYPQHAIATRVRASRSHLGTASQWFYGPHILGLLPLGGGQGDEYAVVWSTSIAEADRLLSLSDDALSLEMQALIASAEGHSHEKGSQDVTTATAFTVTGVRARWPLRLAKAQQWVGTMPGAPDRSWVLLGDAAHTVHPLAGSGLNLGLGDVGLLSQALQQRPVWRSVADRRLLRRYERERKSALLPYAFVTDRLQWLFWQDQPWVQSLRNFGMRGFAASPFKSWALNQVRHA
ncbi:FAD-dependent monooxygenase [Allofranklinella schreckenbergeri]|nr:FAD-dependent monooxygenase [Allofranklinella schreckenbergeri]